MSSPPPSKKRKIVTTKTPLSVASHSSLSQVPPPILGNVMNYLRFEEVRKATLTCRAFNDAAKHVQTLHLHETAELHVSSARRFTNVTEINIFCLLKIFEEDDEYEVHLDEACLRRIVPFLVAWPSKLRKVFVGGWWKMGSADYPIFQDLVSWPEEPDPFDLYQSLIESLCGSFESGALPEDMKLEGIVCARDRRVRDREEQDVSPQCQCCLHILRHFPLCQVFNEYLSCYQVSTREILHRCISNRRDIFEIIIDRPGGKELILSMQKKLLKRYLFAFRYKKVEIDEEDDEEEALAIRHTFWRRMEDAGGYTTEGGVSYLDLQNVQILRMLIDCGCKPKTLSREFIKSELRPQVCHPTNPKAIIPKKLFDELVGMGFLFKEEDFALFDVFTEPAFRSKRYDFLRMY